MDATSPPAAETASARRVTGVRRSFSSSIGLAVLGLLIFVGIFNFLVPELGAGLSEPGRILLGIIFGLVPALLWLIVFYRADRLEPEPRRLVAGIFVAGLLLAAGILVPVMFYFFDVAEWMGETWWSQLLGGILITGSLSMGVVYLAVRALIFDNPEFDERLDGIIYSVAAGLGVATILNFVYVLDHGGVDLGIGSIRMVTNALGMASFAGVLGYFIGQARFERVPLYYMPLGIAISASLVGLYFFLLDQTGGRSGENPWRDLLLATFLALVTMSAVGWLVARSNEETLRVARLNADGDAWEPLPAAEPASDTGQEAA